MSVPTSKQLNKILHVHRKSDSSEIYNKSRKMSNKFVKYKLFENIYNVNAS